MSSLVEGIHYAVGDSNNRSLERITLSGTVVGAWMLEDVFNIALLLSSHVVVRKEGRYCVVGMEHRHDFANIIQLPSTINTSIIILFSTYEPHPPFTSIYPWSQGIHDGQCVGDIQSLRWRMSKLLRNTYDSCIDQWARVFRYHARSSLTSYWQACCTVVQVFDSSMRITDWVASLGINRGEKQRDMSHWVVEHKLLGFVKVQYSQHGVVT